MSQYSRVGGEDKMLRHLNGHPVTSWITGEIIQIEGDLESFWQWAVDQLNQHIPLLDPGQLPSCDHQNWRHSISGHGSTFNGTSRRRRTHRGPTGIGTQVICGEIRPFDGQSASIYWNIPIQQIEYNGDSACTAIRLIRCRIKVIAKRHPCSNRYAFHYEFKTLGRKHPDQLIFGHKSDHHRQTHSLTAQAI